MSDNAPPSPLRLAYLVTHPIQYQAPLLRRIAAMPEVALHVFFQSDISTRSYHDRGFGQAITWDVPLLEGYAHSFLPPLGRARSDRVPQYSRGLAKALREGRYDALWVHGYARPYNMLAVAYALSRGMRVLVRDDVHKRGNQRDPWRERVKEVQMRLLSALGVRFLAIGTLNADYYRELGVSARNIVLAPYAVDNAAFQSRVAQARPHRETLRAELGLTPEATVILFAGKFQARKRAGDLLEAYRMALPRLASAGAPAPWLVYAGSGETEAAVRAAAEGMERVRFLGFQNQGQLAGLFDLCDLFVMPSAAEPWGLVVNEVMNAGKPVVVTEEAGCGPDLVHTGENGFIYPTGDVERLSEHLVTLIADPALRAEMGRRSLQIIDGWNFDRDVSALTQALSASRQSRSRSFRAGVPA